MQTQASEPLHPAAAALATTNTMWKWKESMWSPIHADEKCLASAKEVYQAFPGTTRNKSHWCRSGHVVFVALPVAFHLRKNCDWQHVTNCENRGKWRL